MAGLFGNKNAAGPHRKSGMGKKLAIGGATVAGGLLAGKVGSKVINKIATANALNSSTSGASIARKVAAKAGDVVAKPAFMRKGPKVVKTASKGLKGSLAAVQAKAKAAGRI